MKCVYSLILLLLHSTLAQAASYSVPIDMSVISEHLATATNTILVSLVSEFELAKGTSALVSLASVYGEDFLDGSLTDISSLALQVATVSGKNDVTDSVVTTANTAHSRVVVPSASDTGSSSPTSMASSLTRPLTVLSGLGGTTTSTSTSTSASVISGVTASASNSTDSANKANGNVQLVSQLAWIAAVSACSVIFFV